MTHVHNQLISVFIDKQVLLLKDSEISRALVAQGIPCYTEQVRQHVQLLTPGLFQLSVDRDGTTTVYVDPKIGICNHFLIGRCHNNLKPCDNLHLCRDFGHCVVANCRFPHKFDRGSNRKIVEEMNCHNIEAELLVKFIRFANASKRKPFHRTESIPAPQYPPGKAVSRRKPLVQINDVNRQVDVSYPSLNLAPQVDMEIIEMILNTQGIQVETKLNEREDKHFRRGTLQLETVANVEEVLGKPILSQGDVDIKFKRAKATVDRSSFLLKTSIEGKQEKIIDSRLKLYIAVLVGNSTLMNLIDLSTATEQICLAQFSTDLDFEKVRQQHQLKPQLQNKVMSFVEVYQCDTITIAYTDARQSINDDDLQKILVSAEKNVFAFHSFSNEPAKVEFINADALKQWMSTMDAIKAKFPVSITPMIREVDAQEEEPSEEPSIFLPLNLNSSSVESKPLPLRTHVRVNWATVAAHPKFQPELREYIRKELGGELVLEGNDISYVDVSSRNRDNPINEGHLRYKLKSFMDKLRFETLRELNAHQMGLLRAHGSDVAFARLNAREMMIAARPQDIARLKQKLFPNSNGPPATEPTYTRTNSSFSTNSFNAAPLSPLMKFEATTPPVLPPSSLPPATSTLRFPLTTPEQSSMFSMQRFEDRLRDHMEATFRVKIAIERSVINDKAKGERTGILIKVTGTSTDADDAFQYLVALFTSLRTQRYDEKNDGSWTKLDEAVEVIQHQFNRLGLLCSCQRTSPTSLHVNYFDQTNSHFGVEHQKVDDVINNQFSSATALYTQQMNSAKFLAEWASLEETIRQLTEYKRDICLRKETNVLYIFGLSKLVKEYHQKFEQLKAKHILQPLKITLNEKQLNYLTHVATQEMAKLEKQYKSDGCEVSLARLRQNLELLAPSHMHAQIKDNLAALAQIDELTFEIASSAFAHLINNEPTRLLSLVKSKCYLEKSIGTHRINIPIPKAAVPDFDDPAPEPAKATPPSNNTSISVGQSTINVAIGDLTKQSVDIIVVSATSEILRNKILAAAGPKVKAEWESRKGHLDNGFATSNGDLPCQAIFFLPFVADQSHIASLQKSLHTFILTAIRSACLQHCSSIAFPSVGCGKLNFDHSLIAKSMIDETRNALINLDAKLDVSFILVPEQQNVYDAFFKYLNTHGAARVDGSATRTTAGQASIPYDEKVTKITLISSSKPPLVKCQNEITELAVKATTKLELKDMNHLTEWSHKITVKYYQYCLERDVKPQIDFDNLTLVLEGSRDAVNDAKTHFYSLTTDMLKQSRIHAVARGVIWSVETTPNTEVWEQYSFKLNGIIEDAHYKKMPHVDFTNEKQEKCRIDLKAMQEHHETTVRRVRRREVDSSLPDSWESTDQSCKLISLQPTSKEYQEVLKRFNTTMQGQYSQIVKIERVQNQRWYKQYDAHRDEYQKRHAKLDERLLFHGCLGTSAEQITRECFNRSFAGVNGVLYGCGVYFHTNAQYSHSYAQPSASGERTMFSARVLIGKLCLGNPSMKVAPPGYDTTTDGQSIFVVYHDAAAYAEHLITYR